MAPTRQAVTRQAPSCPQSPKLQTSDLHACACIGPRLLNTFNLTSTPPNVLLFAHLLPIATFSALRLPPTSFIASCEPDHAANSHAQYRGQARQAVFICHEQGETPICPLPPSPFLTLYFSPTYNSLPDSDLHSTTLSSIPTTCLASPRSTLAARIPWRSKFKPRPKARTR